MTIYRAIGTDPEPITLTDREAYDCYLEVQHKLDLCDIDDTIFGLTDRDVLDCYGVTLEQFKALQEEMAIEMRRNIDKYDMTWDSARDQAIEDVIERFLNPGAGKE